MSCVKEIVCGWACDCLLTRLNIAIGIAFCAVSLFVIFETTYLFENISDLLTGNNSNPDGLYTKQLGQGKSIDALLANKELLLCLVFPTVGILLYASLSRSFSKPPKSARKSVPSKSAPASEQATSVQEVPAVARLDTIEEVAGEEVGSEVVGDL